MVEISQGDDLVEISLQLTVGLDDVGTRSPVATIVERPHEEELRLVVLVEDPPVHLAGAHVNDATGNEVDPVEVDLMVTRPGRAIHEELEFETLETLEFLAAASSNEARQDEGLDGKPRGVRLVRNLDDRGIVRMWCRILVSHGTDSGIPLTVSSCLDGLHLGPQRQHAGADEAPSRRDGSPQMTKKLDNAVALYMEGIRDGNAREAVTKYTGDRYTQHSTGVRDGVEGFVEFFEPFLANNVERDIQVVRAIEDGDFVWVHVSQSLNGGAAKWITMDMFDTDADDRIVEHWDVITEWVDESVSGHSQLDGPTEVEDLDKTEQNRATVERFMTEVLIGGGENFTDFISTNSYVQHNPQVGDGLDGFGVYLAGLACEGKAMVYKYIHKVLAQGNFVVVYSLVQIGDDDFAVFDVFRLSDGLIVEHWDTMEQLPSGAALVNQGKF